MYRPSSTVITWAVAGRSSCGAAASPGGRRLARVDIKTMPHVTFTQNIQRHLACPETEAEGGRVRGGRAGRWAVTRTHFLADNASIVLPDRRNGSVYVALGHGHFGVKLHRSANGGRSWEPCAAPTYPPKPEGVDDREPNSGRPIPWNTE